MRESHIEKAVCDHARKLGCIVVKLSGPNNRGIPDRLFLKDGKACFIEFKRFSLKPTALQLKWIQRLTDSGFKATYVDSIEAGIGELNAAFQG